MSAIYILWLRELKRYTRSQVQIIAFLGQPMLYLIVLGFGLGPVFQRPGSARCCWCSARIASRRSRFGRGQIAESGSS